MAKREVFDKRTNCVDEVSEEKIKQYPGRYREKRIGEWGCKKINKKKN